MDTPLHYAAESGHSEICKFILENIEDPNGKIMGRQTPFDLATIMSHEELCKLLKLYEDLKKFSKIVGFNNCEENVLQ